MIIGIRKVILTFAMTLLLGVQVGCEHNSIGPQSPVLLLTAERVESIEVALVLKTTDASTLGDFEIRRDGVRLFSQSAASAETTVVDTTVLPARKYVYQAFRHIGGATQASNILTVTTMDTTSHNYTWDLQTIGVFQSSLNDVWGSSPTDVYAVGRVEVPDGDTQSNVIHFDGNSWRTVTEAAFDTGFAYGEFGGIFGFSANDIWVVGTNVLHWDGNKWKPFAFTLIRTGPTSAGVITLDTLLAANYFTAIWGTSSKDLFAVGDKGVIVHYDGQKWTKMESGTDLTLRDVWGFSSTDVYCVGADFFGGQGIVLRYDGKQWRPVQVDPMNSFRRFGVWGIADNHIYVVGDFAYRFNGQKWRRIDVPDLNILKQEITGTAANNIVVVGDFGIVLHWNGASWKRYDEVSFTGTIRGVWTNGKEVIAVGWTSALGVIIYGKLF